MDIYFLIASILCFIVALIHSLLGEVLVFRRMRTKGLVPTDAHPILKERHVRILWASWHIVTIFGWGFGTILLLRAQSSSFEPIETNILYIVSISMLISAALVFYSTKARHPGWVGLLLISLFIWLGVK